METPGILRILKETVPIQTVGLRLRLRTNRSDVEVYGKVDILNRWIGRVLSRRERGRWLVRWASFVKPGPLPPGPRWSVGFKFKVLRLPDWLRWEDNATSTTIWKLFWSDRPTIDVIRPAPISTDWHSRSVPMVTEAVRRISDRMP